MSSQSVVECGKQSFCGTTTVPRLEIRCKRSIRSSLDCTDNFQSAGWLDFIMSSCARYTCIRHVLLHSGVPSRFLGNFLAFLRVSLQYQILKHITAISISSNLHILLPPDVACSTTITAARVVCQASCFANQLRCLGTASPSTRRCGVRSYDVFRARQRGKSFEFSQL